MTKLMRMVSPEVIFIYDHILNHKHIKHDPLGFEVIDSAFLHSSKKTF